MSLRSPMGRVLGLGSAKEGVSHWWAQRVSAVALVILGLWFVSSLLRLGGFGYPLVRAFIAAPLNAVLLSLLIGTTVYHMWLGMQVIIEDYIHDELPKILLLMGNTFFCITVALACVYAILQISFGL